MAIFSTIGTAIAGALFAGSALAGTIISAGLALGAQYLLGSLSRQKKPQAQSYTAVQGEVQYGSAVNAGVMFGRGMVAGHSVGYWKWGAGNKYNAEQFVLSNGWCHGLQPEVIFYGKKHLLLPQPTVGNANATYHVSGYGDLIEIRFFDGRPDQQADSVLLAATAGLDNALKTTDRGAGLCYVSVTMTYDPLFEQGVPELQFILDGLRCYDPRLDGTLAGGGGAHRVDNPATWEFSRNPAVQRYNYQLGVRGLLSGRALVGMNKNQSDLDFAAYVNAMNVCDRYRLVDGNYIRTYESALYVSADSDHTEILGEFDDAMAGYTLNRSGLAGVLAGAPQIPVLTLTGDDIRAGEGKTVSFRKSSYETFNILSGQYTEPNALWQPESLETVTINADVAADGYRKRDARNDFMQVTDARIAQYLLNIRYRQNRVGGATSVPVSSRVGFKVDVGGWINYLDKTWLVTGRKFDRTMQCTLDLAETSADIYSEAGITPGPQVPIITTPINPSQLSTVAGFQVQAVSVSNGDYGQTPALLFTWNPPGDPTITGVIISYWRVEQPEVLYEAQSAAPQDGTLIVSENVRGGSIYQAKATIRTVPDRVKIFTPVVTTAQATPRLSVESYYADAASDWAEAMDFINEKTDTVRDELYALAGLTATQQSWTVNETQTVAAELDGARASIRNERRVRVNAESALAQQITTVEASFQTSFSTQLAYIQTIETAYAAADIAITDRIVNVEASVVQEGVTRQAQVTQEQTARATADSALAANVATVSAKTDLGTAFGLFKVEATSAPSGVATRLALSVQAQGYGTFVQTGIYMDAKIVGGVPTGQLTLFGNQIRITDPNDPVNGFLFENNQLKAGGGQVVFDRDGLSIFD